MNDLSKLAIELELLIGIPRTRSSSLGRVQMLIRRARAPSKLSKAVIQRLARQLRTILEELKRDKAVVPELQPTSTLTTERHAVPVDRLTYEMGADPLRWDLRTTSSGNDAVSLAGPPVHVQYPGHRSPLGFCRAITVFLRRLGNGSRCCFKRRGTVLTERAQQVVMLASRTLDASGPLAEPWRDKTRASLDAARRCASGESGLQGAHSECHSKYVRIECKISVYVVRRHYHFGGAWSWRRPLSPGTGAPRPR